MFYNSERKKIISLVLAGTASCWHFIRQTARHSYSRFQCQACLSDLWAGKKWESLYYLSLLPLSLDPGLCCRATCLPPCNGIGFNCIQASSSPGRSGTSQLGGLTRLMARCPSAQWPKNPYLRLHLSAPSLLINNSANYQLSCFRQTHSHLLKHSQESFPVVKENIYICWSLSALDMINS